MEDSDNAGYLNPRQRAFSALEDLRGALRDIPLNLPTYGPHQQPSAEDNLRMVLEVIEHHLRMVAIYLGTTPAVWAARNGS